LLRLGVLYVYVSVRVGGGREVGCKQWGWQQLLAGEERRIFNSVVGMTKQLSIEHTGENNFKLVCDDHFHNQEQRKLELKDVLQVSLHNYIGKPILTTPQRTCLHFPGSLRMAATADASDHRLGSLGDRNSPLRSLSPSPTAPPWILPSPSQRCAKFHFSMEIHTEPFYMYPSAGQRSWLRTRRLWKGSVRQHGNRSAWSTADQNQNSEYRPSKKQKPDPTVARATKRLASRFYQLKSGHCLTGQYLQWTTRMPDAKC